MSLKFVKELMPEMYAQVVQGKCPFCKKVVTEEDFKGRAEVYTREFNISGICPSCQDETFK